MPTINDVARRAGVSRSTVSLVINHSKLVKEETRKLVERVIEEINYVPNSNARGLSARVTKNLGVIFMKDYLPDSTLISYDSDQHIGLCSFNIFNGIMSGLAGTDYSLITEAFCCGGENADLPRLVSEKRVDGLFIVSRPYSPAFLSALRETGLPFVLVGVDCREEGIDSIYADPEEGILLAMEELTRTGHRNICLLNSYSPPGARNSRLIGYRMGLELAGLPFRENWSIRSSANNGDAAYQAFRAFWEEGNRPDAIAAANGQSALGAMRYLYEIGVRVPDQISIIAYEDSSVCGYAIPALTSVNIRKEEMGAKAAKCLLRRIREPDCPAESAAIPPYMVFRNSVLPR
ncbi:MAG: LacI family DNA-binding transcriptional regulator [Clostridia bacterium]|nr:LacI family DNA-binding transcriptional regulator [Clostridia bacterium]